MAAAAKHGVKTLGVIGAGQMGLGIAYVAAVRAQVPKVMLCDASPAQLQKGMAFFDKLLAKDVSKGKLKQEDADAAKARLVSIDGIPAFAGGDSIPDMVIEAATENLSIKQKIFSSLASTLPLHTILGTNTSSISITKIAAAALPEGTKPGSNEATESPKRVLGIHWMNPVPVLKLVELIPALQTSQDVIDRSRAFAEACGKTVTFSQDTPGFIANRLLMPYINEAIIVLESGIASKEDIDTTMKLGMAHPMGALELADHIGLDTCYAIMETLHRETGDSKYRPSVLLGRMVDAGWYGKKNGKGFYDYAKM